VSDHDSGIGDPGRHGPGREGAATVERVFRDEYGRLIASLVRRFGDIDLAEEAAGEALVAALEKWPETGVPPNPGGWLTTTAGNRAIDRIRRESMRDAKHQAALMTHDDTAHAPTGPVEDDRLRLVFTCCHPALAPEARIALTLRLLGGLTVAEVAQAFLVPETTMAQRITRAKKKIAAANVPYRVPEAADLPERLGPVLAVLFLVFNEGYLASGDGDPVRAELTGEAIRLTRVLRRLLPDEPEVTGLLAMMLLIEARREARVRNGQLVPLHEQDRAGWDAALVAEGHAFVGVPGHSRRRAGRPVSGSGVGRPTPAPALPRVERRAGRPAPPARPQRRGQGRIWRRPRWDPELGRACVPGQKAR
jgi:RNA polymerase sigma-70 factor (ECF subfamily)